MLFKRDENSELEATGKHISNDSGVKNDLFDKRKKGLRVISSNYASTILNVYKY